VFLRLIISIVAGLLVAQVATLCTTIFLHRGLSHRALTFRPPLRFAFRFLTWITTGIRPRQWVAVHRKHHAFTDVDGDPHSPVLLGWFRVQLTNVALYRREARNPETLQRYAKDLPADRWDRVLFDHALLGLAIGIGILVALLGPVFGLIAALVHTTYYLTTNAAVNAVGHHFGRRPFANSATNLQWLALLTGGEGLHNNHHAAPTSAKLALHRGEIDHGWWAIRIFRGLGLVKVRLDRVVLTAAAAGRRLAPERRTA
jgi:stearoyl-CoA desaturase (delta-9 desaturase)